MVLQEAILAYEQKKPNLNKNKNNVTIIITYTTNYNNLYHKL